jgi:hypothetical protein
MKKKDMHASEPIRKEDRKLNLVEIVSVHWIGSPGLESRPFRDAAQLGVSQFD